MGLTACVSKAAGAVAVGSFAEVVAEVTAGGPYKMLILTGIASAGM